jgi:hypothetical protein
MRTNYATSSSATSIHRLTVTDGETDRQNDLPHCCCYPHSTDLVAVTHSKTDGRNVRRKKEVADSPRSLLIYLKMKNKNKFSYHV